jgi:hypothetical protein
VYCTASVESIAANSRAPRQVAASLRVNVPRRTMTLHS